MQADEKKKSTSLGDFLKMIQNDPRVPHEYRAQTADLAADSVDNPFVPPIRRL